MDKRSPLQRARLRYSPQLPKMLQADILHKLTLVELPFTDSPSIIEEPVAKNFPHIAKQPIIGFKESAAQNHLPLKVGVVLSGGQAPGGHNVIAGLYDALMTLNPQSQLIGFCDGPGGIVNQKTKVINSELLDRYRNQGGFDIIGSGRTKIETEEQFRAAQQSVMALQLDGLVVIGGDDSNTNAAFLAEYFMAHNVPCKVVGVPKTIDGDLKNRFIEISFGFDTAAKIYSEIIGNMLCDGLSAKKYYFFIKLMGRSASHITLECALQTHPNMALIGEEIEQQKKTLHDIVNDMCDLICKRAVQGKNYGGILIPEGVIEFVPEMKQLIEELNKLLSLHSSEAAKVDGLASGQAKIDYVTKLLSKNSADCYLGLPQEIQLQLLLDRDPHGNIQVSKIETERLFIHMVGDELKKRTQKGEYKGKFNPQPQFCGYEGRSGMPTNFDSEYCYALGHVAALLINSGCTGYLSAVQNLAAPVDQWQIAGIPLVQMMAMEMRGGKLKPVIHKALVDLSKAPFQTFKENREKWMVEDDYRYPGPIQFFGPTEIVEAKTITLELESTQKQIRV